MPEALFLLPMAFAAAVLPVLWAPGVAPTVTFFNQVGALGGWGAWLAMLALHVRPSSAWHGSLARSAFYALIAATLLCAVGQVWTGIRFGSFRGGVTGLGAQGLALTLGAAATAWAGGRSQFAAGCRVFAWALLAAAALSVLLAWVQVFAPSLADGTWIAGVVVPGRAVGNLRQPNHLSTLLLMGAAAAVSLCIPAFGGALSDRLPPGRRGALGCWVALWLLTWGVVLTGSRTGIVGVLMLGLWGLLDRTLPLSLRRVLGSLPLAYGFWWAVMSGWAMWTLQSFIGEARLHKGGDLSSSRFAIWSNTWDLITQHPWTGVGWGNFNFAWTLTAFPERPVAFFDHTHNLVLQLLVELGVPLGGLVLGLLGWAYWGLVKQARRTDLDATPRMALYIVSLLLVHSMLEYPLWYAYFLLPTAFVWGLGLGAQPETPGGGGTPGSTKSRDVPAPSWGLATVGVLMAVGAAYAMVDYRKVSEIYAPAPDSTFSLAERIDLGRASRFFAYQADYARVTTAAHPGAPEVYDGFQAATRNLLDARLLIAWAKAEAERGELDKARYLAHRLREFRHDLGNEFLAPCGAAKGAAAAAADTSKALPFQCGPDASTLSWKDFNQR